MPAQRFSGLEVQAVALDADHLCYLCKTPDMPGKFDPVKAAALGVPKGPMYGQLKVTAPGRPSRGIHPGTPTPPTLERPFCFVAARAART